MKTAKKTLFNLDDIYKHRPFHIVLLSFSVIMIVLCVALLLDLNNYYLFIEDMDNTYQMEETFNEQNEMIVTVTFKQPQLRLRYIGFLDAPRIYEQYYLNGYTFTTPTIENKVIKGKKVIEYFNGEEGVKVYNLGEVKNNILTIEREVTNYKISVPLKTWVPYVVIIVFCTGFTVISLYSLYLIRRAEG